MRKDYGQGNGLDSKDLEAEEILPLPARQALSLVNANVAIPVNLAVALNVASDNSVAIASATQNVTIVQSIGSMPLSGA